MTPAVYTHNRPGHNTALRVLPPPKKAAREFPLLRSGTYIVHVHVHVLEF